MTREEAIELLSAYGVPLDEKQFQEAIDMAISALSAEHKDCTDFLCWLLEEIMDEENWELNAEADGEIIARKLKKLGLLDSKDGYYVRTPMYEALTEPSDLISRQAAINCLDDGLYLEDIEQRIEDLPSAERVVRCKDCEHKDKPTCPEVDNIWFTDNDFCSWAKMKGGAE